MKHENHKSADACGEGQQQGKGSARIFAVTESHPAEIDKAVQQEVQSFIGGLEAWKTRSRSSKMVVGQGSAPSLD